MIDQNIKDIIQNQDPNKGMDQVFFTKFHGTKQNTTLTTIQVGKQLNQTTLQIQKQFIIGMVQLGCPNRRLKWPDLMAELLV